MRKKSIIFAIAAALTAFGWYVWPTPYRYTTMRFGSNAYPVRIHRINGQAERLTVNGWQNSTPTQTSTTAQAPCPDGVPAGVSVIQLDEAATARLFGSQAFAYHDGPGANDWRISFTVDNETVGFPSEPGFRGIGYCVTSIEYEAEVRSYDDGKTRKGTGKALRSTPLSPGWQYRFTSEVLELNGGVGNGMLTQWRITKAWGFALGPWLKYR